MNNMKFFTVLSLALFLLVTALLSVPPVSAAQGFPVPGENCGLARKNPNDPIQDVNMCCYTDWQKTLTIPKDFKDGVNSVPVAGGLLVGMLDIVQLVVDTLPFPFIGAIAPLPTFGRMKEALKNTSPCITGNASAAPNDPNCTCELADGSLYTLDKLCANIGLRNPYNPNDVNPNSLAERTQCSDCVNGKGSYSGKPGVWTSVGCIQTGATGFIQGTLLGLGVGFGGVFALLCIIYSAFLYQTSRAKPETLKKAQELMVSCILGLMMIVFSVFILRLIGVTILRIPGLS